MYGALLQQGKCRKCPFYWYTHKKSEIILTFPWKWLVRWHVSAKIGQWSYYHRHLVASGARCRYNILWQFGGIFNIPQNGDTSEHDKSIGIRQISIYMEYSIKHLLGIIHQSKRQFEPFLGPAASHGVTHTKLTHLIFCMHLGKRYRKIRHVERKYRVS